MADADLYRLRLWYQSGGGSGGVTFDRNLAQGWGNFVKTGDKTWGLDLNPAQEILAGSALYLTADINGGATVSHTLRLGLMAGAAHFAYGTTLPASDLSNLNEQTIALSSGARLSWINPETINFIKGQTNASLGKIRLQNIQGYALSLKSLRLSVMDTSGQVQNAGTIFSQISLVYQNSTLAALTAPFAGEQWVFTSPLTIPAQGEIQLDAVGTLAENPGVMNFQISLPDGQCVNQGEVWPKAPVGFHSLC